jgi:hypothetical protein
VWSNSGGISGAAAANDADKVAAKLQQFRDRVEALFRPVVERGFSRWAGRRDAGMTMLRKIACSNRAPVQRVCLFFCVSSGLIGSPGHQSLC